MSHPENLPAFPCAGYWPDFSKVAGEDLHAAIATITEPQSGLSTLDYFAAHAIAGMTALVKPGEEKHAAVRAYALARAMLEVREDRLAYNQEAERAHGKE